MDPEPQERFEKIELKLSEHDEKIIAHDRTLTAIRNLLQTGIRMLVDTESKIAALTDSQTRLYGTMQELAEAQKRTEESLKRFLDRSGNGRPS
ncbi:MAG TPA: hypothetical protein VL240_11470 [Candidatus Binatia bacterium]|nr:hypothetical protein [Candidatus Binatia bacterium]